VAWLVFESGRLIARVGRDLSVAPDTLRNYVRRVEADEHRRKDVLTSEQVGRDWRVARIIRRNSIQGTKRRGKPWCRSPAGRGHLSAPARSAARLDNARSQLGGLGVDEHQS